MEIVPKWAFFSCFGVGAPGAPPGEEKKEERKKGGKEEEEEREKSNRKAKPKRNIALAMATNATGEALAAAGMAGGSSRCGACHLHDDEQRARWGWATIGDRRCALICFMFVL